MKLFIIFFIILLQNIWNGPISKNVKVNKKNAGIIDKLLWCKMGVWQKVGYSKEMEFNITGSFCYQQRLPH